MSESPIKKKYNWSKYCRDYRERRKAKGLPPIRGNASNEYWNRPETKFRAAARNAFHWAIRTGKIIRQPCEICGEPKSHGYHPDYSKPLEVKWLCHKHHVELHAVERAAKAGQASALIQA